MVEPAEIAMQELVKRTAAGDRAAFTELYRKTSPKLFGVAMRILSDVEKASDSVQEAYLQIWRNADLYEKKKGVLEAWMVSIVRFRAIDQLRRDRTSLLSFAQQSCSDQDPSTISPEESFSVESSITLRNCLDKLTQEQRETVLEAHFRGFTHEELADRFAAPIGTIKSRVRRGLFALKKCLEQ